MVDREGISGPFGGGYRLFRRNLRRGLLVLLIKVGLAIGVGIALLIAVLSVGLILFLPAMALGIAGHPTAALVTGIIAALILVLLLVATGAVGTSSHAYWTLAYLRLVSRYTTTGAQPAV